MLNWKQQVYRQLLPYGQSLFTSRTESMTTNILQFYFVGFMVVIAWQPSSYSYFPLNFQGLRKSIFCTRWVVLNRFIMNFSTSFIWHMHTMSYNSMSRSKWKWWFNVHGHLKHVCINGINEKNPVLENHSIKYT